MQIQGSGDNVTLLSHPARRPAPVHTEDAQATPGRGGPRDEREHEQMKVQS